MATLFLAAALFWTTYVYASPTHVPLATATVSIIGVTTDPASNPNIFHDGNGGVSQNGYNMIIFADSLTDGDHPSFVHNSVAYYGYREPGNPTDLYTFGMSGTPGEEPFVNQPFTAVQANETSLGGDFAIWAGLNSMAPLPDGETVVGCFSAFNERDGTQYYSTMATVNMTDPKLIPAGSFPPTKRVVPQLFYPNEVYYGNMGLLAGVDGYLYMIGTDNTGFKLARVPIPSMTNRAQYTYYSAATSQWTRTPATLDDAAANILNFTADQFGVALSVFSADVWYDAYHQTAMIVFMDGGVDGTFRASYALGNALEGPWSAPVALYTPPVPDYCRNRSGLIDVYDGHALHGWDPSGRTLLLSYSSCAAVVEMALLTWA